MSTAPLTRRLEAFVPAAAAGTAQDQAIGKAPFAGKITRVSIIPEATITGQATNFRTLRAVNKGQAGAGSTVAASLAFDGAGVTATAFDERDIPLTTPGTNQDVAEGDVLAADETVAGTGLAHSGYTMVIELSRS